MKTLLHSPLSLSLGFQSRCWDPCNQAGSPFRAQVSMVGNNSLLHVFSYKNTQLFILFHCKMCHSSVASVLLAGTKLPRPSLGYLTFSRVPPRARAVHRGLGGVHGGLEGVRSRGFRIPTSRGFFSSTRLLRTPGWLTNNRLLNE